MSIGILGLGTYLPSEVRTNDWWPKDIVAKWSERMAHQATRAEALSDAMTPGQRVTLAAMGEFATDPFRGSRERRVMSPDMTVAEMEANAAREAIERAGIDPKEIGAVLSQTPVPDYLMVNNACQAHHLLGLSPKALVVGTEAACNAFATHLSLAQGLIETGQAKYVLSLHSSAITRVHGPTEPHSAWWGDGAAAVVIGKVSDGKGLRAVVHNVDGSRCDALVLGTGVESKWYENGSITTHTLNRESTRNMLFGMIDRGCEAIDEALTRAEVRKSDVDFFACHQSTPWLARDLKKTAGLDRAQTMITFPTLGHMNSVNVPYILAQAVREGMIKDGSTVVTFSGGLGETWSSLVLRWGR